MSADLLDHSSSSYSSPELPSESRGSSVSPGLREEYEDILKYAVVAPKLLGESSQSPPPPPSALDTRREGIATELSFVIEHLSINSSTL